VHRGQLKAFGTLEEVTRQFQQSRIIEVQLTSSEQIDDTILLLKEALDEGTEITPSHAEAVVRFRTDRQEEELGSVLTALIRKEIRVTQFREIAGDLEEAFMTVTRSES
jgi:ABC-2 type transport system ATP-binding protein